MSINVNFEIEDANGSQEIESVSYNDDVVDNLMFVAIHPEWRIDCHA